MAADWNNDGDLELLRNDSWYDASFLKQDTPRVGWKGWRVRRNHGPWNHPHLAEFMSTNFKQSHYRAAIIALGEMGSSNEFVGSKYGHLRTVYGRLSHAAAFTDHPQVA